jgi:hypothetical protein
MAKFFTWVEETYAHQSDVPLRIRQHCRNLHNEGASIEAVAEDFKLPVEWVRDFVRKDEKPN